MAIEPVNSINTNIAAAQTARILAQSGISLQSSLLRLSSGLRLTSPSIDPAALAQFMQLDAQIGRLGAADVNLANATSFSQAQEGFLQGVQAAVNRMGELSIQAQDVTKSPQDLAAIQKEFSQLQSFVGDVSNQKFNGVPLFSGNDLAVTSDSEGGTVTMQGIDLSASGANGGLGDVISGISVSSPSAAATASETISDAVQNLGSLRATVGSNLQNLNVTRAGISTLAENLSAATSRIADSDFAAESVRFAQLKSLVQAGTFTLQNAQGAPKSILQLLA